MKLHFFVTGAADWDITRPDATENFRRFASLLTDGRLLIDPGPCLFEFEKTFGYRDLYAGVTDIVCTHRHSDHYSPQTRARLEAMGARFHDTNPWGVLELEHYTVRAYPANHRTAENPMHFVVESKDDGRRVFYGCDGAWMFYETARALFALGRIDLMIFDCTIGDIRGDYRIFEHNDAVMAAEMKAAFEKICPRFMVSHLARTLHPAKHGDAAAALSKYGLETARDNLIVEL